ncbi:MAG: hypothetical protein PHW34_09110 [Hespellia sp.]|nr:hypothetical protein [Hespellia sp.]
MSNLAELLTMIGLADASMSKSHILNVEKEDKNTPNNYLLEGELILSLAKKKKKRSVFKKHNLTVKLCNFNYPKLMVGEETAYKQIESTIKRTINKKMKEITSMECLSNVGIPFLLDFTRNLSDVTIEVCERGFEWMLAKNVGRTDYIIKLTVLNHSFYIPVNPKRRFQNCSYHYKSNSSMSINVLHMDYAFFPLFCLSWLNELLTEAYEDDSILETLMDTVLSVCYPLWRYEWIYDTAPDWFTKFLEIGKLVIDRTNNVISPANGNANHELMDAESPKIFNNMLLLIAYAYAKIPFQASSLVDNKSIYENFIFYEDLAKYSLMTLRFYITNIQDQKEEDKYRKKLQGEVAKAYTTKRNIPNNILHLMQNSELNEYFGFIEFDEDVDIELVNMVSLEFQKLNERYFHHLICKEVALRFRKLGRHHASGLYYPSINTIVIDYRYPHSFVHEYLHMCDDIMGDLSLQNKFDKVSKHYQSLLCKKVQEEERNGTVMFSKGSKYNLNYYLRKSEIFARCGEIFLFRIKKVVSSLLRHEDTLNFAYPDDVKLEELIKEYYSTFFENLENLTHHRKEQNETNLCNTADRTSC